MMATRAVVRPVENADDGVAVICPCRPAGVDRDHEHHRDDESDDEPAAAVHDTPGDERAEEPAHAGYALRSDWPGLHDADPLA